MLIRSRLIYQTKKTTKNTWLEFHVCSFIVTHYVLFFFFCLQWNHGVKTFHSFLIFTSRMMNQEYTYREGTRLVNQFWTPWYILHINYACSCDFLSIFRLVTKYSFQNRFDCLTNLPVLPKADQRIRTGVEKSESFCPTVVVVGPDILR